MMLWVTCFKTNLMKLHLQVPLEGNMLSKVSSSWMRRMRMWTAFSGGLRERVWALVLSSMNQMNVSPNYLVMNQTSLMMMTPTLTLKRFQMVISTRAQNHLWSFRSRLFHSFWARSSPGLQHRELQVLSQLVKSVATTIQNGQQRQSSEKHKALPQFQFQSNREIVRDVALFLRLPHFCWFPFWDFANLQFTFLMFQATAA